MQQRKPKKAKRKKGKEGRKNVAVYAADSFIPSLTTAAHKVSERKRERSVGARCRPASLDHDRIAVLFLSSRCGMIPPSFELSLPLGCAAHTQREREASAVFH